MHWKHRGWILIGLLLTVMRATGVAQVATTQVADTIYHADGTVATGTVLISWPAFTTSSGEAIASGSTSATIGTGGALSVQLTPNAGSTPMGSYYTVVFHLDDGSVSREYWVVPASLEAVKISGIETSVLPTSVAMQTVSKSYVDTAIAAAVTGHPQDSSPYVLKAGDTMTGPLVLPADPTSPTQAADKNYVDDSIAAVASGLGQKVSTLPSATQAVSQPTGTQLEVNRLNGVEYASQYVSGTIGGNGIANAVGSPDCANGCQVQVERDYPTDEPYFASGLNSQTHVTDERGGRQVDSFLNPLDVVGHGASVAKTVDDVSTQSALSLLQQTGSQTPGAIGMSITQEGLTGGSNLFPQDIDNPVPYFKMGFNALTVGGSYNTQGQHGLVPEEIDCFGVGDCLLGSRFIKASGGMRDNADEGAHLYDTSVLEDSRVFAGACASGCTTGATSLMITQESGGGTQGDGRFLIDLNPSKTITSASTGGAIVGGLLSGPHATAQFSGTNFPLSVLLSTGQVIPSQAGNMAPGTVTFAIATTGVLSNYSTSTAAIGSSSGLACVVDRSSENYEMAPYTVVDATHLQMTFSKPHQLMATISIGGLCGYGLEQTVDTVNGIRQLFPVVGAYTPTSVYYSGAGTAVVGAMNETDGFLNVTAYIASAVRSGNVVTVTTTGNLPVDVNGLSVKIANVADSSYNGNYVVTTTSQTTFTYSQSGANSSSTGGTISVLTGGFALYPMAEVLSVFDPATKSIDGFMSLAPNTVPWSVNDPVEQPHYYQEFVSADIDTYGQTVPRPTSTVRAGLSYVQNNTAGLTGWSIDNASPPTNYLGYGGTHQPPDAAYESLGVWRSTMNLSAGERAVFAVHCNYHGCGNWNSPYDLFELDDNTGGYDNINYSPLTSALTFNLRGSSYTISPQALTASTIDVTNLNATNITGAVSGASITSGVIPASVLPVFGPSGSTHAPGAVPDPGATAGAARFLREDGTWVVPSGGGGAGGGGASGTADITGGTIDSTVIGATTPASVSATQLNGVPVNEYTGVPRKPLTTLLQALHNAKSQPVNIVVLSDSFGICDYANCGTGTTVSANRYTEQLRINLQAQFGSHGTGMVPLVGIVGPTLNNEEWAVSGTWGTVNTLGPYQLANFVGSALVHLSNGSVATFTSTIPYDTINTYCMTTSSSGSIAVAIDGVFVGTACGSATSSATAHAMTSSASALGTHVTTFTSTGDSYLYAAEGTAGTTGVSVHNLSVGSAAAEWFGLNPATQLAFSDLIPTGTQGVISMLQTNEPGVGYSVASFTGAMDAIIAHEQALPGSPSFMMVVPPVDIIPGTAPYTAAQVAIAQQQNVAFVNIQDRWGTAYVPSSGLWDIGAIAAGIHPNDKGARDEYSMVYAQLIDPVPFAATANGAPNTIAGLVTAGANVTITGSGTSASPYSISSTGGGSGGGCSVNCTFTGSTAFSSGSSSIALSTTSSASTGTAITLAGTAPGVHTWAAQTDQNGNFLLGDFTAGNYPFSVHYTAAPNGYVSAGEGIAYTWSAGASPSNTAPDTGLSRLAAGSVAVGDGTPGDVSGTLTTANLNVLSTSSSGAIPMGIYDASLSTGSLIGLGTGKTATPHNSVFNVWYNTLTPYGSFETYSGGDPIQLKGSQLWLNGGPVAIGNSSATGSVAAPTLPGLLNVGTTNQFYVDASGNISANLYKGPATAPSGSCSTVGWAFSQDGHATFCNGSTWATKI